MVGVSPVAAQTPSADEPAPFTCEVTETAVTWTSTDAKRYYVRRDAGDGDRYLGSSAGLSFDTRGKFGTFTVISYTGGRQSTTCIGTKGAETYPFGCGLDGPLYWSDQDVERYYVRAVDDGVSRYLGSTDAPPFVVPPADGYEVVIWNRGVRTTTSCPGEAIYNSCAIEWNTIRTAVEAYYAQNLNIYPTSLEQLDDYVDPTTARYFLQVVGDGFAPSIVPVTDGPCDL